MWRWEGKEMNGKPWTNERRTTYNSTISKRQRTIRKEWEHKPLHVLGFETITRSGRLTRLRSQGGNARDVVCALREQLRKESSEFVGAVVIGLSSKYDLLYEVGREAVGTAVKLGWWRRLDLRQIVASEEVRKLIPRILVKPNIWLSGSGRFRVRSWDRNTKKHHYIGTFDTLGQAIQAKENYCSRLEGHRLGSPERLVNVKLSA